MEITNVSQKMEKANGPACKIVVCSSTAEMVHVNPRQVRTKIIAHKIAKSKILHVKVIATAYQMNGVIRARPLLALPAMTASPNVRLIDAKQRLNPNAILNVRYVKIIILSQSFEAGVGNVLIDCSAVRCHRSQLVR